MISPRAQTVIVTRHEFRIDSPATQRDLLDTIHQARGHMEIEGGPDPSYDDAVMIEAQDDEIVVYWTEEKRA